MKGLLHRLAARAAGTAVSVRSDVRLPFGGGDLGGDESVETDSVQTDSMHTDLVPRHLAASALTQVRAPGEPPAQHPAERVTGEREPPPAPMVETPAWQPAQASKPTIGIPSAHEPGSRAPMAASSVEPVASNKADTRPPLLGQIQPIDLTPPRLSPGEPSFGAAARAIASHPMPEPLLPRAAPPGNGEPSLLMPMARLDQAPVSGTPPVIPRSPAWSNPALPAAPANEPTEVHIHIGRIDVTAVHDPTPALPRRPAATPAPMSLDAYLARRGRS